MNEPPITIGEMLELEKITPSPSGRLFEARTKSGDVVKICRHDFIYSDIMEKHPDILSWEVVRREIPSDSNP